MITAKKQLLVLFLLSTVQFIYSDDISYIRGANSIPYQYQSEGLDWGYRMGYMDRIELIGWSRTGLLAYRYINDGGGYGGMISNFVVMNIITDEIIEQDYFFFDNYGKGFDDYKKKWNLLLERHNIVGRVDNPNAAITGNTFSEFPLGNYDCWFEFTELFDDYQIIYEWNLIIGNESVHKIITHQTTDGFILVRLLIMGYFRSPFEDRIAVFVSSGSSRSGDVYFTPMLFGCNIRVGFN